MKKKFKIIMVIIAAFIIILLFGVYVFYKFMSMGQEYGTILNANDYKTSIEIETSTNFMLYINKNDKISNVIYLDNESIQLLSDKKVEGNSIAEGIRIIVDTLSKDEAFNNSSNFLLTNYGDNEVFQKIREEVNKEFVVYGINKDIQEEVATLDNKAIKLGLNVDNQEESIKEIFDYSLNLVNNYYSGETNYSETEITNFSNNVYNKLKKYSKDIMTQSKDDSSGLNIRSINATNDYNKPLYPSEGSWYYIENNKVFANIIFDYDGKHYGYCYNGDSFMTNGVCPE